MQTATIFYIIFALLLSFSVAFFQYYYKVTNKLKVTSLLFVLKTLSLFLLILLLINPTIENTILENEKPVLSILVDNSKSIAFFKEGNSVSEIVTNLSNSADLNTKFSLSDFSFGKNLQVLDSLSFLESETNVASAIVEVNELHKDKIAPIVLITDGNQTIGDAYEFLNVKQPIYPVIIGDTTKYVDLKITQLNVNKYSYLQNKFPVEVLLNYEGNEAVTSQFSIFNNGKTVLRENISFSSDKKSATISANLTSTKEGLQNYTASIGKLKNEKNTKNNSKSFTVEVINEQTKILILSSVVHPDMGALKKSIESNKQRSVDVFMIDDFKGQLEEYKLIILNQVTTKFKTVLAQINQLPSNYLLISGVHTDWNFINNQQLGFTKKAINQSENYGATYNEGFLTFMQEDIGFHNFPPLKDQFGDISILKEHQTLLYQNINGVQTKQPLLTVFEINNQKISVLFGEGIWKWRAASFLNANSFEEFDKFTGSLLQFLATNKKRNRLEVNAESLYPANATINVSAFYTDKNYQFDARASLEITITNLETKEVKKIPFSLIQNSYQVEIENLPSGEYSYTVNVVGQDIKNVGRFIITDYQIEEQFTNANVLKLQQLAANTGGKVFYKNQLNELTKELLENETFYTIQKSTVKQQNLIDWKWILFFIISLLTAEWLIRKYHGKI